MIRIGRYIRINPLTPLLFVICFFTNQHKILLISYSAILLHELAHLAAARLMGLRADNITFHPFGVNLQLKNKIIFSVSDEIILYAAGPAVNILLALSINALGLSSDAARYFYACNMALFFMNILPIAPLDGGIILKKIIAKSFGLRAAHNCLTAASVLTAAALIVTEAMAAYRVGVNYSVLLMIAFLVGNIFTQREKYDIDFVNELMFNGRKRRPNARVFVMYDDGDYRKIAKNFRRGNYGIVVRVNSDGEIVETLTEQQVIDRLIG